MASTATVCSIRSESLLSGLYYKEGEVNNANQQVSGNFAESYQLGTAAGQANVVVNPGTLVSSNGRREIILAAASQNFDFFGSLTDALGQTVNLTKIRDIRIHNLADPLLNPTFALTVSGNLLTAFGVITSFTLNAGDMWHADSPIDGFTVTNTSQERLTLNPGANSFHVFVSVIGVQ